MIRCTSLIRDLFAEALICLQSPSFLAFSRWLVQCLEKYRYKCDTVGSTKQSCADSEKLPLCSSRDYISVADSCEGHNLIIHVVNNRAPLTNRKLRRMRQEIVFESEHRQNGAHEHRPEQERNPNVNRLSSCML